MKLEQLKIFSDDHAWFTDEQNRIKRSFGEKPTQAELFHKLRQAYEVTLSAPITTGVKRALQPPRDIKKGPRAG